VRGTVRTVIGALFLVVPLAACAGTDASTSELPPGPPTTGISATVGYLAGTLVEVVSSTVGYLAGTLVEVVSSTASSAGVSG
jgi:hypothetical protein